MNDLEIQMDFSEISVFHCQVVVYGLDEKGQEWIGLADETWAEMHIFMEPLDVSNYRIVAWIQDTGEVVLNSLLTNKCSWIPVDSDFIQFTDETHEPAGLCFLDQYQAVLTTKTISDILIKLGGREQSHGLHRSCYLYCECRNST